MIQWNVLMVEMIEDRLVQFRHKLTQMGNLVERLIIFSKEAFQSSHESSFEKIFELKQNILSMKIEIDEEVYKLLSEEGSIGRDLKTLTGILKISNDLAHIADQAVQLTHPNAYLMKQFDMHKEGAVLLLAALAHERTMSYLSDLKNDRLSLQIG